MGNSDPYGPKKSKFRDDEEEFIPKQNKTWWDRLNANLPRWFANLILFLGIVGIALGIAAFSQVNSEWSDIKSIHQECKPQKVNEFMLSERIFDTKRTD